MKQNVHNVKVGTGTELFFQHGLASNLTQITSLLGSLENVRLSVIDCPGHGLSPMTAGYQPSFDSYADEVLYFLDQQGIEKAVFGGLSMGAGIALNIAIRYPDRVKGLILLRSAWLDQKIPQNLKLLLDAAPLINTEGGINQFKKSEGYQEINEELALAGQSLLGIFGEQQQDDLGYVIKSMVEDRPFTHLEQLHKLDNIPTLIIGNDNDPLHPFAISETLNEHIDGSLLKKITSRYIYGEQYKNQVQELVSDFLKRI